MTIYPHYYSWWMFINYYNDEYFAQYWHQVFFFVTELCSTGFVLSSVNRELPFTQRKLLMIVRFVSLITKNKWICHLSRKEFTLAFTCFLSFQYSLPTYFTQRNWPIYRKHFSTWRRATSSFTRYLFDVTRYLPRCIAHHRIHKKGWLQYHCIFHEWKRKDEL